MAIKDKCECVKCHYILIAHFQRKLAKLTGIHLMNFKSLLNPGRKNKQTEWLSRIFQYQDHIQTLWLICEHLGRIIEVNGQKCYAVK